MPIPGARIPAVRSISAAPRRCSTPKSSPTFSPATPSIPNLPSPPTAATAAPIISTCTPEALKTAALWAITPTSSLKKCFSTSPSPSPMRVRAPTAATHGCTSCGTVCSPRWALKHRLMKLIKMNCARPTTTARALSATPRRLLTP